MTAFADPFIPPSEELLLRCLDAIYDLKKEGKDTVSIAFFQRTFRLGYTAARKVSEALADRGYISRLEPASGAAPLRILINPVAPEMLKCAIQMTPSETILDHLRQAESLLRDMARAIVDPPSASEEYRAQANSVAEARETLEYLHEEIQESSAWPLRFGAQTLLDSLRAEMNTKKARR